MITDKQIEQSLEWLNNNASEIGKAKALAWIREEGRKTVKASLKTQCNEKTDAAREDFAYNHDDYRKHLEATAKAIHGYEEIRVKMKFHEARIEAWRSASANHRALGNFR